GLGEFNVGNVAVDWPDGTQDYIVQAWVSDTAIVIKKGTYKRLKNQYEWFPLFKDVSDESHIQYKHTEADYNDFATQRLLPQKYSQLGPFITTGDMNGDGLQDFFVGGGYNSWGQLFIQQKN